MSPIRWKCQQSNEGSKLESDKASAAATVCHTVTRYHPHTQAGPALPWLQTQLQHA